MYMSYGWNRAFYTKSDIRFRGADYDFKIYKVKAHDRPTTPISFKNYLRPDRLTIPQTDFRIGYFIKDKLALSFGYDHMKYVMDEGQEVEMKGHIDRPGIYTGTYNGKQVMDPNFLTFEHTDGLNYINLEAERYFTLYQSRNNELVVNAMVGGGAGLLLPKTNTKLMDYERNDRFHVSGYGLAVKGGVEGVFFRHLMVKVENKYGYINMPDIVVHKKGIEGRAKQHFFFTEIDAMVGGTWTLGRNKGK